ncbi:hypothetical protein GF319_09150 [Candidatus Bathyarchaeota archaeon]|nr:hypothetical protein [Candidatus Bathyarchaeota archaeon]
MTVTRIRASLNPTEDQLKVEKAIRNLFGEIEINHDSANSTLHAEVVGHTSLYELKRKIAQDRIRDTIRSVFTRWKENDRLSFGLNRQAAYAGHVSLNLQNEDPMGPIQVLITGGVDEAVEFLCEK